MQAVALLLLAAVGSPWAIPESDGAPQRPATRAQLDDSSILARHREELDRAARQQAAPVAPARPNPYRTAADVRPARYDQSAGSPGGVKLAQYVERDAWPTSGNARQRATAGATDRSGLRRTAGQTLRVPPSTAPKDPYAAAGSPDFDVPDFDDTDSFGAESTFGDNDTFGVDNSFPADRSSQVGNHSLRSNGQRTQPAPLVRQPNRDALQVNEPRYKLPAAIETPPQTRTRPPVIRQAQVQGAPTLGLPSNDPYKSGHVSTQRPTGNPTMERPVPSATRQPIGNSGAPGMIVGGGRQAAEPLTIKVPNPGPTLAAGARNVADGAGRVVDSAGVAADKIGDGIRESARGGSALLLLAFFASVGLNFYLGWIAWDTYNRYQDMVSDMRYTGTNGGRRDRGDREVERRSDRRLAETGAY